MTTAIKVSKRFTAKFMETQQGRDVFRGWLGTFSTAQIRVFLRGDASKLKRHRQVAYAELQSRKERV